MLAEFGGSVQLSRTWAHSLLKRMKFVQRKATTSKTKHTVQNVAQLKEVFLADVTATVTMEEVPPPTRPQLGSDGHQVCTKLVLDDGKTKGKEGGVGWCS